MKRLSAISVSSRRVAAVALFGLSSIVLQPRVAMADVEATITVIEPKEWEEDPKTTKTIPLIQLPGVRTMRPR